MGELKTNEMVIACCAFGLFLAFCFYGMFYGLKTIAGNQVAIAKVLEKINRNTKQNEDKTTQKD